MIGFGGIPDFYQTVWEKLPELWGGVMRVCGQMPWKYVMMFLLNALTGSVCELVMLMLSVTIGSIIARKHKILAAVGVYYGMNVVISMVSSAAIAVQVVSGGETINAMLRFFGSTGVLMAVISVAGYFLMYYLIDRRLNLN